MMTSDPSPVPPAGPPLDAVRATVAEAADPARAAVGLGAARPWWAWIAMALAGLSLVLAWQSRQQQRALEPLVAQRVAEVEALSQQLKVTARMAEEQAREAQAKVALLEQRLSESVAQRSQLEALMLHVSKSRDETALADLDALLRTATQHGALTGRYDTVVGVLKQIDERAALLPPTRAAGVRRAVKQDLERLNQHTGVDPATLAQRLDEVAREAMALPWVMPAGTTMASEPSPKAKGRPDAAALASAPVDQAPTLPAWRAWLAQHAQRMTDAVAQELRALVRVTRIDQPSAALLAPDQRYFVRENLRLRLLSARWAVMARQQVLAINDIAEARRIVEGHFDRQSAQVQNLLAALDQLKATTTTGLVSVKALGDDTHAALQVALAAAATTPARKP